MSRRIVALALTAFLAVTLIADAATAAPGGAGGDQDGDVLTADVTYEIDGHNGGPGRCSWELADGAILQLGGLVAEWPYTVDGVTYHLYKRTCDGNVAYVQVPERDPVDLLPILLEQLRQTVLPHPEPVFQLLDPEFGWAYVRTPVDFRAGGNTWRRVSVTAEIGPVWATVTAVPSKLTFDPGDPSGPGPVDCTGDAATAAYVPAEPGSCSYTYLNASSTSPFDGYHFQTSMSIEWSISWTSSTGAGGPLDAYSTSSTALLAVAEVKGLVTCTGSAPQEGGC